MLIQILFGMVASAMATPSAVEQVDCTFQSQLVEVKTGKATPLTSTTTGQRITWQQGHVSFVLDLMTIETGGKKSSSIIMNKAMASAQDPVTLETKETFETMTLSQRGDTVVGSTFEREQVVVAANGETKIINLSGETPDFTMSDSMDGQTLVTVVKYLTDGKEVSGFVERGLVKTCRTSPISADQVQATGFFAKTKSAFATFEAKQDAAIVTELQYNNCLAAKTSDCLDQRKQSVAASIARDQEWENVAKNGGAALRIFPKPIQSTGGPVFRGRGTLGSGGCERDMLGICYPQGATAEERAVDAIRYMKDRQREEIIQKLIQNGGKLP